MYQRDSNNNKSTYEDNTTDIVLLDEIDKRILCVLQQDARMSVSDIAKVVHLSASPCARRIKRLEELGVITAYRTIVNPQKLGYTLALYIAVSMDKHTADRFSEFEAKIKSFDEVVSCSIVTGRTEDYLLKVMVKDMRHYEEFLLHRLNRIEGVSQVHTSFELREVFNRSIIRS